MASSRRAPRHDVSRLQILRQRPPHGGRWRTACGFLIHLSDSQIFKQPNHKQKPIRASCRQNIITRLATRCARVVEKPSALGLVRPRRGRAGCRVPDAPAALCAKKGSTSAHKYSQRRHRKTRQSRTQWCYCLCRALLGEVLYCARPPTEDGLSHPVGRTRLRENYPSIRGGTTRFTSPLQYRSSCAIFCQLTGST